MNVRFPRSFRAAAVIPVAALAALGVRCTTSTTPVPIRTFDRPQKIALACLNVNAPDGAAEPSVTPEAIGACPPVPPNTSGTSFQNHLYALVTQQSRGELAVVDLTGGGVVDEDKSTPGVNLIPVGALPSDVVTTPDSLLTTGAAGATGGTSSDGGAVTATALTFVASEDPNGYAIYGIPNERLLGDSTGTGGQPLRLTDLFACSLPQSPQALGVLPVAASSGGGAVGYVIVALLRARAGSPARIAAIDPTPFESAAPGTLNPCSILGSTAFVGAVPDASAAPRAWPDGVPYADTGSLPDAGSSLDFCSAVATDGGADSGSTADAGAPDAQSDSAATLADSVAADSAAAAPAADAGATAALALDPPRPTAMVLRDDAAIAYVADGALPLVHVIDLSQPTSPREIGQMLATSVAQPSRRVKISGLALSPVTRDLRRYLYALDAGDGTLMVFDATTPSPTDPPQTPMHRPHAELNPFTAIDRIAFGAPVSAVTFVQHDWPLTPPTGAVDAIHAYTGLLCNPNTNAIASGGGFVDGGLGGYYRADQVSVIDSQGSGVEGLPTRLRGIFAFVALSNGTLATIDVDDWDAPCRRPDPMDTDGGAPDFQTGVLDLPEPAPANAGDLDPYHAPQTVAPNGSTGVTQEAFFPVSQPHRVRSNFLLRNDPTSGVHLPYLSTAPQLFDVGGAPVSFSSTAGASILLPTALPPGFVDPSHITNPTSSNAQYAFDSVSLGTAAGQSADSSLLFPGSSQVAPAVRIAYDDPTAHIDQDWTITYEGVLPTANGGIVADISASDYQTLTLTSAPASNGGPGSNGARFCDRGVEDHDIGAQRAQRMLSSLTAAGLSTDRVKDQASWTADYVEVIDDLLPQSDGYWSTNQDCWQGLPPLNDGTSLASDPTDAGKPVSGQVAAERYGVCSRTFSSSANADVFYTRDFPILRATSNALEIGTFTTQMDVSESPQVRTIVGHDPRNVQSLKVAKCCFHNQVSFKIRAGGEWVTSGQVGQSAGLGLLRHVVTDPGTGRCVLACDDPTKVLLSSRAFEIPPPQGPCNGMAGPAPIGRDSPLALRNPMFSFVLWSSCAAPTAPMHTQTARDHQWRFSIRGGYTPISVSIAGTTGVPASPQSMLEVGPFGQLAVIDGASQGQGLVLFDLNTLGIAHTPYN